MQGQVPKNRVLPSKEATLFKTVLQLYEARQWKKGVKTADQILKKHPDHGETLSMKGLILTNMQRKEEGLELVRKGVRMDLTSHICWHVLGLVHKADRNYEEALKSYTQALRFEKENLNILRDAAHLQMQLRNFDSLVETRQLLLRLRANVRQSWTAMAIAYHLNGQLDSAKQTLELYEKTVKDVPAYDTEHSELLLYHVRILEELGLYSDSLTLLDTSEKSHSIIDRTQISITRARLFMKLEKPDDALVVWDTLIKSNPECYDYYKGHLSVKAIDLDSLDDSTRETAIGSLKSFAERYPRAVAPKRILLSLTHGDEFKQIVEPYILHGITRGIPSLFADIKKLYNVPEKRATIESIVEELKTTLETSANDSSISDHEPPTTYIWTLYFLVQHYASLPRTIPQALELADRAIAHTPTLPELYMIKARSLKRAGDPLGASEAMSDAWRLDLQDRFLNTKNAEYLLHAGFIEEGNKMLGLFTKKSAATPGADLEDMQSLFYVLEDGDAHNRAGKLHLALKRYHGAFKIFDDIEDDQYDFHSYALRKYTFNTYLQMIKMQDTLRSHPAYAHAAHAAARIYVRLFDDPKLASPTSSLTEAEKKAAKKAKKAELKLLDEAKKIVQSATTDEHAEPAAAKDEDPEGHKLLAATDPLEQAAKRLAPLLTLQSSSIDTWLVSYDVAIRRKKYLQALRALNFVRGLDAENPDLHARIVDFKSKVDSVSPPLSASITPLVSAGLTDLVPEGTTLESFNSAFLQRHSANGPRLLAAAQAIVAIRGIESGREEAEALSFQSLHADIEADIQSALATLEFLRSIKSPRAEDFRIACDERYPLSTIFKSTKEIAALRAARSFSSVLEDPDKEEEVVV